MSGNGNDTGLIEWVGLYGKPDKLLWLDLHLHCFHFDKVTHTNVWYHNKYPVCSFIIYLQYFQAHVIPYIFTLLNMTLLHDIIYAGLCIHIHVINVIFIIYIVSIILRDTMATLVLEKLFPYLWTNCIMICIIHDMYTLQQWLIDSVPFQYIWAVSPI